MEAYLDNAATTSLAPEVLEAMLPFMRNAYGNPSSTYAIGREVKMAVEQARRIIAGLLNAYPSEIYFTSGGTEADNAFLRGLALHHKEVKHAITSPIEHHAVLHTLEDMAHKGLITLHMLDVNEKGEIDVQQVEALLRKYPQALVSLMHGNNEIGNLNDVEALAELCKEYNAFFHSDTVQTLGYYSLDTKTTLVDSLAAAGHKFHGPKGAGFMYLRKGVKIAPFITGGSQERNMRGGTENSYGIIGLAKAFELSLAAKESSVKHMNQLKEYTLHQLSTRLPNQFILHGVSGDVNKSLPSVLNMGLKANQGSMLLFNLDLKGVYTSGGSACSSGSQLGSHVIHAIRKGKHEEYVPLRLSFSKYTTKEEIDFAIAKIVEIVGEEQPQKHSEN